MFFWKSKKKQLAKIKYELFLLRDGLRVQKEHSVHLAKTIERLYDYMIEKVKEIEVIK